ncbi:MAG TPA: hypothetical protein VHO69_15415, partial [Phototrophicaceae bacterium]|nr:hypothetical protein [Phototrophicaceae bacterium]
PTQYALRLTERWEIDPSADATSHGTFMNFMATETALVATYQGRRTPAPMPTPTPLDYIACAWQWATTDLPEVAEQTQAMLAAAGLEPVTVNRVSGFGENCIAQNGEINRFAVKETDFFLTVTVADLADKAALGTRLNAIYQVFQINYGASFLNDFHLRFTANNAEAVIDVTFAALQTAITQGLTGAELWAALDG